MKNWLHTRGKSKYIDFNNFERQAYRELFKAFDIDGSGAIGVKELEDP